MLDVRWHSIPVHRPPGEHRFVGLAPVQWSRVEIGQSQCQRDNDHQDPQNTLHGKD